MGRYTTVLGRNPSDVQGQVFENLNKGISGMGSIALQEQLKDRERKQKLQDAVQTAILEAALKNQQLKKGADLSTLDSSKGIQGILGQIGNVFEPKTDYSQMKALLGVQDLTQKIENQRKLRVMGGQEEPSMEEIAQFTPQLQKPILGMGGQATGGEVALPKGATFEDGQMFSETGEPIGSYLPGYEPKAAGNFPVAQEEVVNAIRERFAGGISKEELQRKALGLPKFSGRATQGQIYNAAVKLAQAENPLAGEKEIQAKIPLAKKMMESAPSEEIINIEGKGTGEYTDAQEKLIQDNMNAYPDKNRDEIIEALQDQGYL